MNALLIGCKVGPYEITAKLGEGGMGEVYRATDTKLKREVAIKVLPAAFIEDKERLARFEREAQLLAQLHHPNIASVFGLEDLGGVRALVMELVEGEDLAARIARGPLPLDEALAIAQQIADGLEAAHERGIVHRDLKPANVKVRGDGAVKVLDFGLAKALDPAGGSSSSAAVNSPTLMQSPTLTAARGTELGVVLGTAAYMAPEQARGGAVDKRADIWAWGAVLFEMLTGGRLFAGETVSDTLAAVLRDEIDLERLLPHTPSSVRQLLARCLERNPRQRLRDIGDARLALEEPSAESAVPSVAVVHASRRSRALPWAVAVLAAGVAGWALWTRAAAHASAPEVMRFEIAYPPGVEPVGSLSSSVAISPDGRTLAMIGVREGRRRLYVRSLDRPAATEVTDSAGMNDMAFSPDSTSLVFIPGNAQATKLSLVDQKREVVARGADLGSSVSWGPSGIYYLHDGVIWIAPPNGAPRQLTRLDAARHEVVHPDPLELPGGGTVLFSSLTTEPGAERIEAVSLADGRRRVVLDHALQPIWSPTGHLLFGRDGTVLAVPFDPERVRPLGEAVPVVSAADLGTLRWGNPALRLSTTGTLVYTSPDFDVKRLVSVQRDGTERALDVPPGAFSNPRLSPDGRRLAYDRASTVLELLDLARGTHTQLTTPAFATGFPSWTADGSSIVVRRFGLPFVVSADGSGRGGAIAGGGLNDFPSNPGPAGDQVLDVRIGAQTAGDLYLLSAEGRTPPHPILATKAYEGGPDLSPDGNWLCHQSDESGQPEIYVRRYPAVDRAWQVSEGGGVQPHWRADGREIYFRNGKQMMGVSFDGRGPEPALGRPAALFADEYAYGQGLSNPNYAVTRDGRFIMLRGAPEGGRIHVALHWTEELKRLVASGGLQ